MYKQLHHQATNVARVRTPRYVHIDINIVLHIQRVHENEPDIYAGTTQISLVGCEKSEYYFLSLNCHNKQNIHA